MQINISGMVLAREGATIFKEVAGVATVDLASAKWRGELAIESDESPSISLTEVRLVLDGGREAWISVEDFGIDDSGAKFVHFSGSGPPPFE
jgi:hypothetical protein